MPSAEENGGRRFLRNVRPLVATSKEIELKMRGSNIPPIVRYISTTVKGRVKIKFPLEQATKPRDGVEV